MRNQKWHVFIDFSRRCISTKELQPSLNDEVPTLLGMIRFITVLHHNLDLFIQINIVNILFLCGIYTKICLSIRIHYREEFELNYTSTVIISSVSQNSCKLF